MNHHHNEIKIFFNQDEIIDEIEEAEKLDVLLKTKYPRLDFQIVIILVCDLCYCNNTHLTLSSKSKNIVIENIIYKYDNENFEKKYCELIKKIKSKYSN